MLNQKKIAKGKAKGSLDFPNYEETTTNCGWMAIHVLSQSKTKYQKFFKNMLFPRNKDNEYYETPSYIIPSRAFAKISKKTKGFGFSIG